MSYPAWDLNVSLREFKQVLKHPQDKRFPRYFARVLSRVPFYQAFHGFITPQQFKKYYRKVRRLVDADPLGAGRLEFWEWLYKRLS